MKSLNDKYRPKNISEIVEQSSAVSTLSGLLHGSGLKVFLFHSTLPGVGKTTAARILAKVVNCTTSVGDTADCCGTCDNCKAIDDNKATDIRELNFADQRGIDAARDLIEQASYMPFKLRNRVFIIDEAHQATGPAQNALLKVLEEPPTNCYFVLCTTSVNSIIPTIRSRCTLVEFSPISNQALVNHISTIAVKENILFDKEGVDSLIEASGGSLRDAMKMLEQCGRAGGVTQKTVENSLGFVTAKLPEDLIKIFMMNDRKAFNVFIGAISKQRVPLRAICKDASKRCIDWAVQTNLEFYNDLTALFDLAFKDISDEGVYVTLVNKFSNPCFIPIENNKIDDKKLTTYMSISKKLDCTISFDFKNRAILHFGGRVTVAIVDSAAESPNLSLDVTHIMLKDKLREVSKLNALPLSQLLLGGYFIKREIN